MLVVDDNATNRMVLHEVLTRWGMRPALADGAARRSRPCGARPVGVAFPLVLPDVMMPGVDGYQLAERVRQSPTWPGR